MVDTTDEGGPAQRSSLADDAAGPAPTTAAASAGTPAAAGRPGGRGRSVLVGILGAVAVVAVLLSLLTLWAVRTVVNEDLFVARVGPVIDQQAVAQEVGTAAAEQIVTATGLQERVTGRLPAQLDFAAGPLTSAAEQYLAGVITRAASSEQAKEAWYTTLRLTHRTVMALVTGETDRQAISTADGQIVLDLTPVIAQVVARSTQFLSDVLGRPVEAPQVSPDQVANAKQAIEDRLGVQLPDDFGHIVLADSAGLEQVQTAYSTMRIAVLAAPIIALLLVLGCVLLARRRLRALLIIVASVGVGGLLMWLALPPLRQGLLGTVQDQGFAATIAAAFDTVTASLVTGLAVCIGLGALALLGLAVLMWRGRRAVPAA